MFALYAMVNQVFCVPYRFRYGFGPRYLRVILVVLLLGLAVVVVGVLWRHHDGHRHGSSRSAPLVALAVAFSLLFIAPKILSRRPIANGEVMLGAIVGAVALVTITNLAG